MSYAIITVGGKQYRVSEGQRLLVDRISLEDGDTFTPSVLLVGGDGATQVQPADVTVTARVVEHQRGPKIRIGKYRQRTGYRRHTGFRSALTQIEIESIGSGATEAPRRARAKKAETAETVEAVTAAPVVVETAVDETPKPKRVRKPKADPADEATTEETKA